MNNAYALRAPRMRSPPRWRCRRCVARRAPALAQIQTRRSERAIDGDLCRACRDAGEPRPTTTRPLSRQLRRPTSRGLADPVVTSSDPSTAASQAASEPAAAAAQGDTYKKDDLIGAAEGVFGKGAEGVARMIEDLLKKQGEPNAYIVGREAGGAFVVGAALRLGHAVPQGRGPAAGLLDRPVDRVRRGRQRGQHLRAGLQPLRQPRTSTSASRRARAQAYFVGGLNASYMRKGDMVLIPIRVGAGLRLGVNAGYMKFSKKQTLAAVLSSAKRIA